MSTATALPIHSELMPREGTSQVLQQTLRQANFVAGGEAAFTTVIAQRKGRSEAANPPKGVASNLTTLVAGCPTI